MLRALGKVSLGLLVTFALATACGGDDGKKNARRGDGGAGGEAGASPAPNDGGTKTDGGQPPVVVPQGGQGGEAPVTMGGAGGEPIQSLGGAGGEGGEPATCCQPTSCNDAEEMCGYFDRGCGLEGSISCYTCPAGKACNFNVGTCDACVADPNWCDSHCGDTVDNCNNPVSCPDNCGESEQVCSQGFCCSPQTECVGSQCGTWPDGCGGIVECGNTCEGAQVCSNTGFCCVPDTICGEGTCGIVSDGCGGTLDCTGNACPDGSQCLPEGRCLPDECAAQGSDCGTISTGPTSFTECGSCPNGAGCIDTVCTPLCLR